MAKYKIDQEQCINCGICASVCMVYDKVNGHVVTEHPRLCIDCGHCHAICPKDAIVSPHNSLEITVEQKEKRADAEALMLLLKTRRSTRRFKKEALQHKDLAYILEAGSYAPTGSNAQDVKYAIVNSYETMQALREEMLPGMYKTFAMGQKLAGSPLGPTILGKDQAYKLKNVYGEAMDIMQQKDQQGEDRLFYGAPALMVVYGEKKDEAGAFSAHIAMHNCALMAETLGIGCLLNSFALMAINTNPKMLERFKIPKGHKVFGVMTMGYKNVTYKKHVYRKPANVTYIE